MGSKHEKVREDFIFFVPLSLKRFARLASITPRQLSIVILHNLDTGFNSEVPLFVFTPGQQNLGAEQIILLQGQKVIPSRWVYN